MIRTVSRSLFPMCSDIIQLRYKNLWCNQKSPEAEQRKPSFKLLNRLISRWQKPTFVKFKFLTFYNHYTKHSSWFCVHTPVPLCYSLNVIFPTATFTATTLYTAALSFLFIVHLPLCVLTGFYCRISVTSVLCFKCHFECQCFCFFVVIFYVYCGKSVKSDSQDHITQMKCQVYF